MQLATAMGVEKPMSRSQAREKEREPSGHSKPGSSQTRKGESLTDRWPTLNILADIGNMLAYEHIIIYFHNK